MGTLIHDNSCQHCLEILFKPIHAPTLEFVKIISINSFAEIPNGARRCKGSSTFPAPSKWRQSSPRAHVFCLNAPRWPRVQLRRRYILWITGPPLQRPDFALFSATSRRVAQTMQAPFAIIWGGTTSNYFVFAVPENPTERQAEYYQQ